MKSINRRQFVSRLSLTATALGVSKFGYAHSLNLNQGLAEEFVVSKTTYGKIRGLRNEGVNIFKGVPYGGKISGERRFRASQLAGLKNIPAYVRTANDQSMLEMALVENIQRENLNAIEIAISYKRLIDECKLSQEDLGNRVGKDRSTITNYLRLLKLPPQIQTALRDNKISMGHARAIINIENPVMQLKIFSDIIAGDLSVRTVEEIVRGTAKSTKKQPTISEKFLKGIEYKHLQKRLEDKFETKIEVKHRKNGSGQISFTYFSTDDLNRLLDILDA